MSRTKPLRILGVGDNVVDRYREIGRMFPGGNPVNAAVGARRAGAEAGYIGRVGSDRAGRLVLEALRQEGVDVSRVRVADGPNAYAEVDVVDGERVFVRSDKGVRCFQLEDADLTYAATFDLVHSGEFGGLEGQIADVARVSRVAYDFGGRRESSYLDPLLPHVEVACFSASELDEQAAADLLKYARAHGARVALATRGAAGALFDDGRQLWHQPIVPATVVDTLGAGDSFVARFLVGYLRGDRADIALGAAASAAALTCQCYGAFGYGETYTPDLTAMKGP